MHSASPVKRMKLAVIRVCSPGTYSSLVAQFALPATSGQPA